MALEKFALDLVLGLLTKAIASGISYAAIPYFTRRKIERRIEDATAEVVEPLIPFLEQEGISEDKQRRLIQTCVEELEPFTNDPKLLFQGSLNGQRIFEEMYANRSLPQVILEDGLKDIYMLLCPRIATLLGRIPAAVKDWESEAWTENFRRLDDMTTQMRSLFSRVDELAITAERGSDETLTIVRRALAQKIGFALDLTGLRADSPIAGKFDDFFIHPQIREVIKEEAQKDALLVETPDDSFRTFIAKGQLAILIGAPGAGKSTWSKWLQKELLTARWAGISIRVELRGLNTDSMPSLHELVRQAAGKHLAEDLTADRIANWLQANRLMFILDGFDEIRPEDRDMVLSWISELSVSLKGCCCVVTSRPLTTEHLNRFGSSWGRWNIEPFDQPRIVDYIQRWYSFTPLIEDSDRAVNATLVASGWRRDPTIGPLTGNPLLLSTLLMVHHLDGRLPSGRSQLYQRYVGGMLGLWDDRRKVVTRVGLTLHQKRQVLRSLALLLFLSGQDQIEEPDLLEWLQQLLDAMNARLSAPETLAVLRERSGLIVGPGIYSFAHKSIAEYLVAETVLQGDQQDSNGRRIDRFRLFEHRDDDRWNTVTFLWAGLAPIADVESFIDESLESRALPLACGILDDQHDRIPRDIQQRLLRKLLLYNDDLNSLLAENDRHSYWIASSPASLSPRSSAENEYSIPSFRLRSLTPLAEFTDFIRRVVRENFLSWKDVSSTTGLLRELLWMTFASHFRNQKEWKNCLLEPTENQRTALWFSWVVEYIVRVSFNDRTTDLNKSLMEFKGVLPSYKGLVPFALMSVALGEYLEKTEDNLEIDGESISLLLKLLPECDEGEIEADFLAGTKDWVLGSGRVIDEPIGDLFTCFEDEMRAAANKGVIQLDDSFERAMSFVKDLKSRREALL
jgi:hypothetical protein